MVTINFYSNHKRLFIFQGLYAQKVWVYWPTKIFHKMEDQILQLYQNLITSTNVEDSSNLLGSIYANDGAFLALLNILNSDQNDLIKHYAILGLKVIIKGSNQSLENINQDHIKSLFQLLLTTSSPSVASCIVNMINDMINPFVVEMIINFVQQAETELAINASLRLIDENMEMIGINENTMNIYQTKIQHGFQMNVETQIEAISCTFHLTSLCMSDLGYSSVFSQSIQLLLSLSDDSLLSRLLSIFQVNSRNSCNQIINPSILLQSLFQVIEGNSKLEIKQLGFNSIISLIDNYPDEILQSEFVDHIFAITNSLVQELYVPEDPYEMSPFFIIEPIAEYFSQYTNLLDYFLSKIQTLQNFSHGIYFTSVFLNFSLDEEQSYDFYRQKIDEIIPFLCQSVSINSLCTRESLIFALSNFSIMFFDEIQEMTSIIQETVLNTIAQAPSMEMIDAFSKFIDSIGESDQLFDRAINFLVSAISQVPINFQEKILWCIASLIKTSNERVHVLFLDIFNALKPLMEINDQPHQYVKGVSIYCVAHLLNQCPSEFHDFGESFAQFLLANLTTSNDSFVQTQCINAYSYLLQKLKESTVSTVEQMVQIMIKICHETNTTSEMVIPITTQDISLRVLCCAAANYPNIFQRISGELFELIRNNSSEHSAIGINLLIPSLAYLPDCNYLVPQLISIILQMIDSSIDFSYTEKCLNLFSTFIETFGSNVIEQNIFDTAAKAFTFELPCFTKKKFNDEVHSAAQLVFRQAIDTLKENAFQVLGPYIDLFVEVSQSKTKKMSNLALQILAEIIQASPSTTPEIIGKTLQIAIKEAEKGDYIGFFAIKSIASAKHEQFSDYLRSIIPQMINFLQSNKKKSESALMAKDNCVSALGSIIMNYVSDYSIDESTFVILNEMPPAMDVSENENILKFFVWLYGRSGGNYAIYFAPVLIRLFTDPYEMLKQNMICDETIQNLQNLLRQLVGVCGGFSFCESILNGDHEKLEVLSGYL